MTAMALIEGTSFQRFRDGLAGAVLEPGDPAYDDARVLFNAMIDRRPAVIAQCASTADVVAAVRFARDAGLEIAVRGGGHGVAGRALCDDGLVIDLRRMNGVSVDPAARVAVAGGGATMSHLDRATEPHRLATTGGRVSTTGVGGFVLGGGNGWLDRKMGLACDNLVAAEVVTADGRVLTASARGEPRALLGAARRRRQLRGRHLADAPPARSRPGDGRAPALGAGGGGAGAARLSRLRRGGAPTTSAAASVFLTGPPEAFVPEDMHGRLALGILLVIAEPEATARATMAPMLGLGHRAEMIAEMPYAELQCLLDDPPGFRNYWSAEYLARAARRGDRRLRRRGRGDDRALAVAACAVSRAAGRWRARPPTGRCRGGSAPWCVHPFGLWADRADDARGRQWARDVRAAVAPWATGAVYLNFIGDEGEDRVRAGFGDEAYRRLGRVKREYDPDNVFHLNHNIRPA